MQPDNSFFSSSTPPPKRGGFAFIQKIKQAWSSHRSSFVVSLAIVLVSIVGSVGAIVAHQAGLIGDSPVSTVLDSNGNKADKSGLLGAGSQVEGGSVAGQNGDVDKSTPDTTDKKAQGADKSSPDNKKGDAGSKGGASDPKKLGGSPGSGGGTTPDKPITPSKPDVFKANCINIPSSCGYPDATNTGPKGKLNRIPQDVSSGPGWSYRSDLNAIEIEANTVVQNVHIEAGSMIVKGANVTIKNSYISSAGYYPINCAYGGETRDAWSCLNLTVLDTEIQGLSVNCLVGMAFNGYTAKRVHIHGCVDGFKADSNVLIEDSYVTGLRYDAAEDTHNDGVQTTGGSNVTIRHNTFKLGGQAGISAVFQFGTEWDIPNSNWTVDNNLIDGGGWMFNANEPVANMKITNNRFTKRSGYGIGYVSGASYKGNYYDDTGAPIAENN